MALMRHARRPACKALLFHNVLRLQNCEWLDGLHSNDVRGTTCTMLADAGCRLPEIAAMLGWGLPNVNEMQNRYQAQSARQSGSAVAKLEGHT
jgi:hypothetical protein